MTVLLLFSYHFSLQQNDIGVSVSDPGLQFVYRGNLIVLRFVLFARALE